MPDYDPSTDYSGGGRYQYQGQVDPLAPSVSNGQITPEQWAAYQAKRRREALFGTLMTLGGMFGGQSLVNAMGIGSGAGAASEFASVPGAVSGAPITSAAQNAALGLGTPTVTAGGSLAPYAGTIAGTAAGTAKGVGSGIGASAGAGSSVLGMSGRDLAALAAGLTGTIGGALSKPPNMTPNTMTQDPNLQRLMQTMQGRLDKSEPLYDSIMAMANGLLPTQYQKGGGGMG